MSKSHPAYYIEQYAQGLLLANVDVGGRVFTERPTTFDEHDVPALYHFYDSETVKEIRSSDDYHDREEMRILQMTILIVVANDDNRLLNDLRWQAESCMGDDLYFAKRMPDYDPNENWHCGLLSGSSFSGMQFGDFNETSEARYRGLQLSYNLHYVFRRYLDLKLSEWESWQVEFVKPDDNDEIIYSFEGELNNG